MLWHKDLLWLGFLESASTNTAYPSNALLMIPLLMKQYTLYDKAIEVFRDPWPDLYEDGSKSIRNYRNFIVNEFWFR